MTNDAALTAYVTRLGDNALVLGQRLIEWVAAGPELEEELANANFALDYIGQARLLYSYAGEREGAGRGEDDFAFLRPEHEYRNLLLVEQADRHFGDTIVRRVLFASWYVLVLDVLTRCRDAGLAAIAARAVKEVRYHLRHDSQWLIRLGDGTEESHARAQDSLDVLWRYTGEMFVADELDDVVQAEYDGPELAVLAGTWHSHVGSVIQDATLEMPGTTAMASGGKQGRHGEAFGYLLAELQYLQRAYPGAQW